MPSPNLCWGRPQGEHHGVTWSTTRTAVAFHLLSLVVLLTLTDQVLISFPKFAFCPGHLLLLKNSSCFSKGALFLLDKPTQRYCLTCLASLSGFVNLTEILSEQEPCGSATLWVSLVLLPSPAPLKDLREQLWKDLCNSKCSFLPVLSCLHSAILAGFTIQIKQLLQGRLHLRLENIAGDGTELPAKAYTPRAVITSYADQQVLSGRQRHFSRVSSPSLFLFICALAR